MKHESSSRISSDPPSECTNSGLSYDDFLPHHWQFINRFRHTILLYKTFRCMGGRYSSTHSKPRYEMKVSSQLRVPTASIPKENTVFLSRSRHMRD